MQSKKAWLLASAISLFLLPVSSAIAAEVTVTPANMGGWIFSNTDNTGTNASGGFEVGPSTPPLGIGSAQFIVGSSNSSEILAQAITPTEVGNFTTLSYSTYVTLSTPGSGSAPTLDFDLFEGNTYEGRAVFDPGLLGTVTDDTWQSWNASVADAWYLTDSGTIDPGVCSISGSYCTFAQVAAILDNDGIDAVDTLFKAGSGQANFNGNVDAFTLNSTTYDFDPTAVPEPLTLSLFGAGLAGAVSLRRRKKAKAV